MGNGLVILFSIIAGLFLATISNWLYDIGKRHGHFPDQPSLKNITRIILFCLPLVLVVATPSMLHLEAPIPPAPTITPSPTPTIPPSTTNKVSTANIISSTNSTIIQNSNVSINPTQPPLPTPTITPMPTITPGPSPTPNAYEVDVSKLVSYPIAAQNTKIVNLDGYGPDEIITMGGNEGLPHINVHAYISDKGGWMNVLDTVNICDEKYDILNLKQDGSKQLVL